MKKLLNRLGQFFILGTPLIMTLSCSQNTSKSDSPDDDNGVPDVDKYPSEHLIPYSNYQYYQDNLTDDQIALAIIDDEEWWVSVIPYRENTKLYDVMNITDIYVDSYNTREEIPSEESLSFLGEWTPGLDSYFIKGYQVSGEHIEWQEESTVPGMFTWDSINGGSKIPIAPGTLYQFSYGFY